MPVCTCPWLEANQMSDLVVALFAAQGATLSNIVWVELGVHGQSCLQKLAPDCVPCIYIHACQSQPSGGLHAEIHLARAFNALMH